MKYILFASFSTLVACGSNTYYATDPVREMFQDQAFDARLCADRFDAVEAAAASLDGAIKAGDAISYGPRLEKLNANCGEFYNGFLTRSSTCPEAMRKAGDSRLVRQMVERVNAVCEIARGLPADMPDQPGKYEQ